MRLTIAGLSSLLVVSLASPARADNDSLFTLGVGTHTVVEHAAGANPSQPASTMAGMGVSARARFLYFLGAELSYEVTGAPTSDTTNVPKPVYQLSGLLYLYTGKHASLCVVGGLGATQFGDLLTTDGKTSSYHGGLGLEIAVTPHWIINADGRVNLPAYSQVMSRMPGDAATSPTAGAMTQYYNFDSWQVGLGVRYYL